MRHHVGNSRLYVEIAAVVVAIGLLASVNLPAPLHGDAALYQLGARAMASGDMIYRDFWDLKQPGIYLFHWFAGSLFGFTETGLHSFELLCMLAFAVLQVVVLRRHLTYQWLAPAVPLLTIGGYYALSTEWHLTQPAILLSAPLFLVLALLTAPATRWRSFLAGSAAAVAVLFKFAVAPVAFTLLFASWYIDRYARGTSAVNLWRDRLLPALTGGAAVALFMALWLNRHHALQPFLWILHTWIPLALEVRGAHPVDRVVSSTIWFVRSFTPLLLLAPFAWVGWRGLGAERLFVLALAWLISATVCIAIEPFAGWEFDFLMLVPPLGVLAVRGVDGLLAAFGPGASPRALMRIAAVIVGLALIPTAGAWGGKARRLVAHAGLAWADDHAFQRAVSPRYQEVWDATAFLRETGAASGPIYVFGDPLVHMLARRPQAGSVHGWAWELQPPVIWRRLESELLSQPPMFIFAEPSYDSMVTSQSPALRAMLDRDYSVKKADGMGTWYVHRDATDPEQIERSR
jgi:hypothetical protein